MFIFWDNSNIHFSGINYACPKFEPGVNTVLYRTYFKNLFALVRNNRPVTKAFVAGSVPPREDDIWGYIRKLGIDLTLLDRTADGKEQESVDILLQNAMLHTILDEAPDTIAVLTGDGAGFSEGKGFLAELERARKLGWRIEVYSWEGACNRYMKKYAEEYGRFVPLDKFYYSISFIKTDIHGMHTGRLATSLNN